MNTSPPRSSVQTQCKTCLKCVQVNFKHILNINPFPINMTSLTTVSNFLNSARPMFNKGTQLGNQIKSNLNKTGITLFILMGNRLMKNMFKMYLFYTKFEQGILVRMQSCL